MIPIRDRVPSSTTPVVTVALIAANLVAFLFELSLGPDLQHRVFTAFGVVPALYTQGLSLSPAPFFTSMFLHGGWMHLISNMWSLWLFGDNVEDQLGRFRFLAFYLLCGVASALAHVGLNWASPLPVIGASGAVAGVMGAYFVTFPNARILTIIPIFVFIQFVEIPAFVYLGFWFLSQVFSGTMQLAGGAVGGIAFWAHVGGFLVGIGLLAVLGRRRRRRTGW